MSHLPQKGEKFKKSLRDKSTAKNPHANHALFPRSAFCLNPHLHPRFSSINSWQTLISSWCLERNERIHPPTKGVAIPYSLHDFFSTKISQQMDVSKNRGIPKSSIFIGFFIINHPFWGTPIFGNTQIRQFLRLQTMTTVNVQTRDFVPHHVGNLPDRKFLEPHGVDNIKSTFLSSSPGLTDWLIGETLLLLLLLLLF